MLFSCLWNAFTYERSGAEQDFFSCPSVVEEQIGAALRQSNTRVLNLCLERQTLPKLAIEKWRDAALFQYNRQILKPNSNVDFSVPSSYGFEGAMKGDYYYLLLHAYLNSSQSVRPEGGSVSDLPLSRFCSVTSTEYVVTQLNRNITPGTAMPVPLLDPSLFSVFFESPSMNVRLYKVLKPHPRCFFVTKYNATGSHNEVLDALLNQAVTVPDLVRFPFIELKASDTSFQQSAEAQVNEVKTLQDIDTEHVSITTDTAESGYLVLSDQNFPGWEVTVDGVKSQIFTANGFMRAVHLEAGKHSVLFSFQPKSLQLGWLLFALGVFLAGYLYFEFVGKTKHKFW